MGPYPPPRGGYPFPPPAPFPPPPPRSLVDPNQARANSLGVWSVALSLIAMLTCCAPMPFLSGWLAIRSGQVAKEAGLPKPVTGVIGLILSCLGLLSSATMIVVFILSSRAADAEQKARSARIETGRAAAALSRDAACDMATELANGDEGLGGLKSPRASKIECTGTFEASADRASLKGMTVGGKLTDVCFAKTSRWYVAYASPSASCQDLKFLSPSPNDADEKIARDTLTRQLSQESIRALTHELRSNFHTRSAWTLAPESCPTLSAPKYTDVNFVDFDLIGYNPEKKTEPEPWPLLSSKAFEELLRDPNAQEEIRAKAARKIMGDRYIVMFYAERKRWPTPDKTKGYFNMGYFTGEMVIVDRTTWKALCKSELTFESSDSVKDSRYRTRQGSIESDFRDRFKDAAKKKLSAMTKDAIALDW